MSLQHTWPRLPGPADLLAAIVEDLRGGNSVLVGLPENLSTSAFAVEVADLIKRKGLGGWETVELGDPRLGTPMETVARQRNGRGGAVLWVDATNDDETARTWADDVRKFGGGAEASRICVAMSITCAEASEEDNALRRRIWGDFVTVVDTRVLVERNNRHLEKTRAHIEFKSALVAALAGSDLFCADRLSRESLKKLLDSRDHPHQRIWEAQVSILLPLVERQRRRLLDAHRDFWHQKLPDVRKDKNKNGNPMLGSP